MAGGWIGFVQGRGRGADAGELDRLESLEQLPFPTASARSVLCVEALQFAGEPRRAADELIRILAPGGMLLLTATAERPGPISAGYSRQPSPVDLQELLAPLDATLIGWLGAEPSPPLVFGLGFKAPVCEGFLAGANRLVDRFQAHVAAAAGRPGWWTRFCRRVAACLAGRRNRHNERSGRQAHFIIHERLRKGAKVNARQAPLRHP